MGLNLGTVLHINAQPPDRILSCSTRREPASGQSRSLISHICHNDQHQQQVQRQALRVGLKGVGARVQEERCDLNKADPRFVLLPAAPSYPQALWRPRLDLLGQHLVRQVLSVA